MHETVTVSPQERERVRRLYGAAREMVRSAREDSIEGWQNALLSLEEACEAMELGGKRLASLEIDENEYN